MKILIVTQKVDKDDDVLGFFHRWLEEFAKLTTALTVISLEQGAYSLPPHVKVFSLGKERGKSKIKYIFNFYKYIWQERKSYNMVFVHMNPIYIVLGGIFWKLMGKKIALWYTHRQVDMKLRLAAWGADIIFSSAKESFRLPSKKLHIVGHGIDTEVFAPREKAPHEIFSILHVGRITKIKNCDILIKAAALVAKKTQKPFKITFIGKTAQPEDVAYEQELKKLITDLGVRHQVEFVGSIPNRSLPHEYHEADITVNLTPTGGIDKAVLESFSTGTPALVTNEAFAEFLGDDKQLLVKYQDPEDLADKITALMNHDTSALTTRLGEKVRQKYSVTKLIPTLINEMKSLL